MPSIHEVSLSLKSKISDPVVTLTNLPVLPIPLKLRKKDILGIERMTRCMFIIHSDRTVYVSTVFNPDLDLMNSEFETITAHKCYDSIYYSLSVE